MRGPKIPLLINAFKVASIATVFLTCIIHLCLFVSVCQCVMNSISDMHYSLVCQHIRVNEQKNRTAETFLARQACVPKLRHRRLMPTRHA
jgi:hypothetical protein